MVALNHMREEGVVDNLEKWCEKREIKEAKAICKTELMKIRWSRCTKLRAFCLSLKIVAGRGLSVQKWVLVLCEFCTKTQKFYAKSH